MDSIESLAWLSGDWRGEGAHAALEEHYTRADGGTILGTSREIREGRSVHREFLLFERADDTLTLTVIIPLQRDVVFRCSGGDAAVHVFEAPTERLTFRRSAPDRLHITFEKEGRPPADFHLRRAESNISKP